MTREISAVPPNLPLTTTETDWHFVATDFNIGGFVYTPFFVNGSGLTFYTGGSGTDPQNGVLRLNGTAEEKSAARRTTVIPTGPEALHYNYFRAPRVAKAGSELWMLVEVSGCYEGCDSHVYPKSLATYRSLDDGLTWTFLDFVSVDGKRYVAKWFGHTGLVYNPKGSATVDLADLTKNRFVTLGEDMNLFVSADGVHYRSVPINHPFPRDRLVFASIARTPYGFHLTSCANWSDHYHTTTVRHLFSKDLVNWYPIESSSPLKNPAFYKGVQLTYEESTRRLWAHSPCGSDESCGFLAWLEARDFLIPSPPPKNPDLIPTGEFVYFRGETAMILGRSTRASGETYRVRFSSGRYDSGYTRDMFTFPLAGYRRQGCSGSRESGICVGDAVKANGWLASILGYTDTDPAKSKFAVKFISGVVDTGYPASMISLP